MTNYGELSLPTERPQRHRLTGRFLPGHTAYNKGKTWDDYMTAEGQRRSSKGWKNLQRVHDGAPHGGSGMGKKKVVGVRPDGTWVVFSSINAAGKWCDGKKTGVSNCCALNAGRRSRCNRQNTDYTYHGLRWYYESDPAWLRKIK